MNDFTLGILITIFPVFFFWCYMMFKLEEARDKVSEMRRELEEIKEKIRPPEQPKPKPKLRRVK